MGVGGWRRPEVWRQQARTLPPCQLPRPRSPGRRGDAVIFREGAAKFRELPPDSADFRFVPRGSEVKWLILLIPPCSDACKSGNSASLAGLASSETTTARSGRAGRLGCRVARAANSFGSHIRKPYRAPRRSSLNRKTSWRLSPRWVMWCGTPTAITRVRRGIRLLRNASTPSASISGVDPFSLLQPHHLWYLIWISGRAL